MVSEQLTGAGQTAEADGGNLHTDKMQHTASL